eukprot:TRINITY_DN70772_c0_g1_i1.p1 TRINITY_DN70772_c0_g1~~TRINITY_DN70772_c0_g1_i1.p1  ORF type:complete len:833 (+),score=70.22 TRINITY_DN70772_c0_g1_i1:526-3024(+)
MIKIEALHVEMFRGIRELDLEFGQANFGIRGPNGTGKSGVVDAIEFCLTGDITRLSGEGSGDLSVAKHGPHVDVADDPAKSIVTIRGHLPSLGKDVTITRSIAKPKKPKIEPEEPDVIAAMEALSGHPEFALSRREIVKYIITAPGQRAKDVQILLRLDEIGKVRLALTTTANRSRDSASRAGVESNGAAERVKQSLNLADLSQEEMLTGINERRKILGLAAITELVQDSKFLEEINGANATSDASSPKDTLEEEIETKSAKIVKNVAIADVKAIKKAVGTTTKDQRTELLSELEELSQYPATFQIIRQEKLVEMGIDLLSEDSCPLCDKDWIKDDLEKHLQAKLAKAEDGANLKEVLSSKLLPLINEISAKIADLDKIEELATVLVLESDNDLEKLSTDLAAKKVTLEQGLTNLEALETAIQSLQQPWLEMPKEYGERIEAVSTALDELPEASKEDTARDELSITQERYDRWVERDLDRAAANDEAEIAEAARDHFNTASKEVLEGIYDAVADEFSDFYRRLNKGDEDTFTGKLSQKDAKLNLDVDFYGRGEFPPGAFHSEGHQDGMGLCLYLALMKHTLGDEFRFAVLDDVLMSVDSGHRREVCRLLVVEFPNTQFILTTHDRVWLQYMKTEKLISGSETFASWTVDDGPRVWKNFDVWADIEAKLDDDNIAEAAASLRRYLEHVGFLLSDGLAAPVRFRADGHYTLNDLLPPGLTQISKNMKAAKQAAQSWGKADLFDELGKEVVAYAEIKATTDIDNWMINPSVHFNEWENLNAPEFKAVVDTYCTLISAIECGDCGSFPYLLFDGLTPTVMRCNCGARNFDMTKKPT